MKAIVPVAGIGNRLKPHTFSVPKPLLQVAGRPILAYVLEPLTELDLEEVIFVVGFKGNDIREYVKQNYRFPARFVTQEQLLGLGYAIHLAMENVNSEPVVILLGDTIVEGALRRFIDSGDNVLGVHQVKDPRRFGIVEVSEGVVTGLEEKPTVPKSNLALVGVYSFKDSLPLKHELQRLVSSGKKTSGEIQLTDVLANMIESGHRFVPQPVETWYDCGNKDALLESNRYILNHREPHRPIEGSTIIPPVYLAESATVTGSVIGPHVSISDGAEIISSIIRDSIVGVNVRIENAVVESSLLGHNAAVHGSSRVLNVGESSVIDLG